MARKLAIVLALATMLWPLVARSQEAPIQVEVEILVAKELSKDSASGGCTLTTAGIGGLHTLYAIPAPEGDPIKYMLHDGKMVNDAKPPFQQKEGCLISVTMYLKPAASYEFQLDTHFPLGTRGWKELLLHSTVSFDFIGELENAATTPQPSATSVAPPTAASTPRATIVPTATSSPTATSTSNAKTLNLQLVLEDGFRSTSKTTCEGTAWAQNADLEIRTSESGIKTIYHSLSEGGVYADSTKSPTHKPACLFTWSDSIAKGNNYSIWIGNRKLAQLDWASFDPGASYILSAKEHGSSVVTGSGLASVAPTPTPQPTATFAPTATYVPQPQAGPTSDGKFQLIGSISLRISDVANSSSGCFGTGGYGDIGDGVTVVVRDGQNNILGVGKLKTDHALSSDYGCVFDFSVVVPKTDFYQLEIGHRTPLVYTFEEMKQNGWQLGLSIGD